MPFQTRKNLYFSFLFQCCLYGSEDESVEKARTLTECWYQIHLQYEGVRSPQSVQARTKFVNHETVPHLAFTAIGI